MKTAKKSTPYLLLILTLLISGLYSNTVSARILASNKPLALIAAATYPTEQIDILVPDGMSPHDYSLRPSDIGKIRQAEKVLWSGSHIEPFLEKFEQQSNGVEWLNATELMKEVGLYGTDPHVWLSPELAIEISKRISEWNPIDVEQAKKDHEVFANQITQLITDSNTRLAPVHQSGFFVFHQAYDYWFRAIGIEQRGSFTLSPERKPGARQVNEMRNQLQNEEVTCIFTEPQFSPALVTTLIQGLEVKQGQLDPLAGSSQLTKTAYVDWLSGMLDTLEECLR
jgi:zinc transport system substrate-binding protein